MSNIAGKTYAMNVITPVSRKWLWVQRAIFLILRTPFMTKKLRGLNTLSLIHYARWTLLAAEDFPRLSDDQPPERLRYAYMLFFSNYNGSWDQYIDSFHTAIPRGLDLIWRCNVGYPKSVPLQPFLRYIQRNQIWTDHYYTAYPMASANDVKSALVLRNKLVAFIQAHADPHSPPQSAQAFQQAYHRFLYSVQYDLHRMEPTPLLSKLTATPSETEQ